MQRAGENDRDPGSLEAHNRLVKDILLELGKSWELMVWRNETGVGLTMSEPHRPFHYGLIGSSDIFVLVQNGPLVGLEVKTGNATQSKQQRNFHRRIKQLGHEYCVVRSVQEAVAFVRGVITRKGRE